jgi:hypothetical protein
MPPEAADRGAGVILRLSACARVPSSFSTSRRNHAISRTDDPCVEALEIRSGALARLPAGGHAAENRPLRLPDLRGGYKDVIAAYRVLAKHGVPAVYLPTAFPTGRRSGGWRWRDDRAGRPHHQ